jgi:hypothetical protein
MVGYAHSLRICTNFETLSDSPLALITSVLEAVPALAGTQDTGFAWTLYTGDLVAHDPEYQLSRQA